MVVLQHMLMPKPGVCMQKEMYYRADDKVHLTDEMKTLSFYKYAVVWFDTYFNSLSIEKWRKYTNVGKISVRLKLKGKFEIQLLSKEKVEEIIAEKLLSVTAFESAEPTEIMLPFESYDDKGAYFVRLEALSAGSVFYGGEYLGEIDGASLNNIDLAVNICTFKREAFVKRNLNILNDAILDHAGSGLSEHLQIFISDNGQTLDRAALSGKKIHIVPNKNVGGAGGFTRGLIEIMHCDSFRATHVLFMDDDIVIEPEALYRTYMLLRCAKERYHDAFIGGAMLRLDQPNIQVEAGATWNKGELVSLKHGLDLNLIDGVLYNETEETAEYNAWWYCCTPMSVVSEDNLPLPIFIRGDDLEYGLRNMKQLILMNGICVWHEPFENKYSSFLNYYILRNLLYDNALHCPTYSKKELIKRMRSMVLRELMFYRYKNVELIFRGIEDFFKGVDFLKETDGEALHKEIMAAGYQAKPVTELDMAFSYPKYEKSLREEPRFRRGFLRIASFNGLFLPPNRDVIVSMVSCRPINCYRAKRVMFYDSASKKAFVTERDVRKMISLLFQMCAMERRINREYDEARRNFTENATELTTILAWERYLTLRRKIQ